MPILAIVCFAVALVLFLFSLLVSLPQLTTGGPEPWWRGWPVLGALGFWCAADFLARGGFGG